MEQYLTALPSDLPPRFYENAQTFLDYVSAYDLSDPKIALKLRHTFYVVEACHYLGREAGLKENELYFACLIGLLHDIGRFEQLSRFNSFDDSLIPHAKLSVELLFSQDLICHYLSEELMAYAPLIHDAILYHGVFQIPKELSGPSLFFTKLIRDADKLDNFRVKAFDSMKAMLDVTVEELNEEKLSDYAFHTFMEKKPLLNSLRETHLDMWLSYAAYLFDLNFPASFRYLEENGYVTVMLSRVLPKDPLTRQRWDIISQLAQSCLRMSSKSFDS